MRRTIATMSAAALAGAAAVAGLQVIPGGPAGGQVPDPAVTLPGDPVTTGTSTPVEGPTTTAGQMTIPGETTTTAARPGEAGLPQRSYLPLTLAKQLAAASAADCAGRGFPVTVAVVDAAGVDVLTVRADGATAATVALARGKAYTAAGFKTPTAVLAEAPETSRALAAIPNVVLLPGGQPITAAGEVVGGIGVSGAPAGEIDDACATAGITVIADHLA